MNDLEGEEFILEERKLNASIPVLGQSSDSTLKMRDVPVVLDRHYCQVWFVDYADV